MSSTVSFPSWLICSSTSSSLLLRSSSAFFISVIVFLWPLFGTFLCILSLHWNSYCIHPFFSQVQGGSLWPLLWIFFLIREITYFCFINVLFWDFHLVLWFKTYSSVSWFYPPLCVCFYVLNETATSPSFEPVMLYRLTLVFNHTLAFGYYPDFNNYLKIWFVIDRFQLLKVCQGLSVFQREEAQKLPDFELIVRQFLRQQVSDMKMDTFLWVCNH